MGKDVKFKRGSKESLENLALEKGSIILALDKDKQDMELYYDYDDKLRIQLIKADTEYDSTSVHPQSGLAVAKAIEDKSQIQLVIWEEED